MVSLPPHPQEKDVHGELNELHFSTHFEISSNFLTETVFAPILIRRSKKNEYHANDSVKIPLLGKNIYRRNYS